MPVLKRLRHLRADWNAGVAHVTLDPKGQGVARVFLIPPKPSLKEHDSLLVINSQFVLTVSRSWAFLLRTFFQQLAIDAVVGREIDPAMMQIIVLKTALAMKKIYPGVALERFQKDLDEVITIILAVARGQDVPPGVFQGKTLAEYAKHLRAPLRVDLLVSPMTKDDGTRDCPLGCHICYDAGQDLMRLPGSLPTEQWLRVIDHCREVGIPDITLTGGEPLTRKDIVQLVAHAQWHLTRLNTSGVLLTPELARALYVANLDAIQITMYSDRPEVHDGLVGKPGAWALTTAGISNALAANLLTSVNTPLLLANRDYAATLRFLAGLGIRYVSCSGLIPTGGAPKQTAIGAAMSQEQMFQALADASTVANGLGMELNFTSPGILTNQQLAELNLQVPVCGACQENMAVTPRGMVVPCQSALRRSDVLGDFLGDKWSKIWNSAKCKAMRNSSAGGNVCPLGLQEGAK